MKKNYMRPQSSAVSIQCRMMLTESRFDNNADEQYITPDDEEYNDGFTVKGYTWSHFFEEW